MTNYAEALACGYEDSVYPTESFYSVCLPCLQISISSLVVVGMHHMEVVVVVVAHLGIRIPVVGQDTLGKAAVGTLVVSKGCIPVRSVKVFNEILFNLDKYFYRVAHLLRERNMLTSNSKFRHQPRSQDKFTPKRNFKFGINISLSRSRWATLYLHLIGNI